MNETEPSPEAPTYTREQVIEGFKKFIDRGILNPDDLPLDDPEVAQANAVHVAWGEQAERKANQSPVPGAMLEYSFSQITLMIDAGFTAPEYLEEVANGWLDDDFQEAQEEGLTELAAKIQARIDEINARLAQ